MPNLIALSPLSRELMLTRLEADDWGDSTDGTQYEQEDHGYAEHYDGSFDHDYRLSGPSRTSWI